MNSSRAAIQLARESDQQLHLPSYNAALDFAKSRGVAVGARFSEEPFGHVQHPEITRQRELWWPCVSDDAADEFSVVEVYNATNAGAGFYFRTRKATSAAKLYAGNEDYPLFAGGMGWIKLITPYEPITVISSDLSVGFLTGVTTDGSNQLTSGGSMMQTLTRPEVGTGKVGVIAKSAAASGVCDTARFYIASSDSITQTALGVIIATPNGCQLCDLPETLLGCTVIEIHDPSGCYFNEPADSLFNLEGWARYMQPVSNTSYPIAPQWEVFSLCCQLNSCIT